MSTAADDNFAESVDEMFDLFGEPAVYFPRSGPSRAITVVLNREPAAKIPETGRVLAPKVECKARDSATTGILHTEIDRGDELQYPVVKGSATLTRRPIRFENHAQGGLVYLDVT